MKEGESTDNADLSQNQPTPEGQAGGEAGDQQPAGDTTDQQQPAGDVGVEGGAPDKAELDFGQSAVAKDPKKSMIIGVIALVLVGIVGYYFVGGEDSSSKKKQDDFPFQEKQVKPVDIPAPTVLGGGIDTGTEAISSDRFQPKVKVAADTKKAIAPPPKAPIAPAVALPVSASEQASSSEAIKAQRAQQAEQQKQAKLKSSIMHGGGGGKGAASGQQTGAASGDKTRDLTQDFKATSTPAVNSKVTKVGEMSLLITQGKIIEAVLETPLNTNYPGPIRAIISRDVFSEQGENVLIPKGSRVIGELAGGYTAGQDRILIKWSRILMADGHDIMIQKAEGSGKLGEIGVVGTVHREFFATIGNSLLISAINVAFAKVVQGAFAVKSSSSSSTDTQHADGSTTSTSTNTSDPTTDAAKRAVKNLDSITENWAKQNFLVKPYITIDQGTIVKIFVNQDILFSSHTSGGVKIIQ